MNSASRGEYPPHFTQMLWGFRRDYVPWVYYFHYNLQHLYQPLDAAGHGVLAQNYYALRRNGLDAAYRYAAAKKDGVISERKGAFYHDVTDRYGRGANYDSLNCTCGAQIAMQLWRHARYCGDRRFLEETALPVMRGVVEFYLDLLTQEADGIWHIHGTTPYEGNPVTDDSLTDLVMIRALFPAYLPYADEEMREKAEVILPSLDAARDYLSTRLE